MWYRRTAAFTKTVHISPVMLLSISSMVDMGQSFNWLFDDHRRSQLLPVQKTYSIGLNSGE